MIDKWTEVSRFNEWTVTETYGQVWLTAEPDESYSDFSIVSPLEETAQFSVWNCRHEDPIVKNFCPMTDQDFLSDFSDQVVRQKEKEEYLGVLKYLLEKYRR